MSMELERNENTKNKETAEHEDFINGNEHEIKITIPASTEKEGEEPVLEEGQQLDLMGNVIKSEELLAKPKKKLSPLEAAKAMLDKKTKEAEAKATPAKKEQVAKVAAAKKSGTVSAPPKIKKNIPDSKEKFGTDYEVYYARGRDQVPKNDMTVEQIREFMEVSYPEMSKERTSWSVDREKKYLFPDVSGAKKG